MEDKKRWFDQWTDAHKEEFCTLSRQIWSYAELGMEEQRSANQLCSVLEEHGFSVERELGSIPTAFVGRFGSGKPVIGFLGEFDALEGLSQKSGLYIQEEQPGQKNGHGCGHNLLGCGALAAAVALKDYMVQYGLTGSICYYGCPGEERGCGKMHMVQGGCFQELDAALTWHPTDENRVEERRSLADLCMEFQFKGISAHAAVCPHLGRSALDAVELLNIACNFMREHIIPEARIHYAITDPGGKAPNVVPAYAAVSYEVRAPEMDQALQLRERLVSAAQGAALMTGTEMEVLFGDSYSDYRPNHCLNQVLWETMQLVGAVVFDKDDEILAGKLRETFAEKETWTQSALRHSLTPYTGISGCLSGSTDVGNVSHMVPTAQIYTASCALGTPGHSWQMVSQTGCGIGEEGMLAASKILALTGLKLLEKTDILQQAWNEFRQDHPDI